MPDLDFQIQSAEVVPLAASPQLRFAVEIRDLQGPPFANIESVMLRVQIRIEPKRRSYKGATSPHFVELFGERERWGGTMRSLLWTHVSLVVPAFTEKSLVDLLVECSFDFNIAATKYFGGLDDGEIPLCFLFSGTVFYRAEEQLQAAPVSWQREANFSLPLPTWKEMMAMYYPNSAWLCLDRDVFESLAEYKNRQALPSWDQALAKLLAADRANIHAET